VNIDADLYERISGVILDLIGNDEPEEIDFYAGPICEETQRWHDEAMAANQGRLVAEIASLRGKIDKLSTDRCYRPGCDHAREEHEDGCQHQSQFPGGFGHGDPCACTGYDDGSDHVADIEKRGAVKALRGLAAICLRSGQRDVAQAAGSYAFDIETGREDLS
jgi:hypothetical protein